MNIKKLFLALFFIFSFQIKAFSNEESSFFIYSNSCDFNKYGGRSNDCVQFFQPENLKKLKDYSRTLNTLQKHFKLLEGDSDLSSRLCHTFSLDKNEPVCPIPLPQFSGWIQNYEFSCLKESHNLDYSLKESDDFGPLCPAPPQFSGWIQNYELSCLKENHNFDYSLKESDDFGPLCPIPLPQLNNLVKNYKLYCSSSSPDLLPDCSSSSPDLLPESSDLFSKSHDLLPESSIYYTDPICPIPLPQ